MFNTNLNNLGSIACGSLELFDSAVDFDDLAFMQMIMCMQESDKALAAKMKEIRALNAAKRDLTDHIARLNNMLASSSAKKDEDFVAVKGGLDDPVDLSEIDQEVQHQVEEDWKTHQWYQEAGLLDDDSMIRHGCQNLLDSMDERAAQRQVYRKSEVEAKIEELRGELEDMNSSSSVMMIDLQRLMNKRNEAVQFVSNVESRSHKTAMAIVNNFA